MCKATIQVWIIDKMKLFITCAKGLLADININIIIIFLLNSFNQITL